jgi:HEAT repeat protein
MRECHLRGHLVLLALSAAVLASGCSVFGDAAREQKRLAALGSSDARRRREALIELSGETTRAVRGRVRRILVADPDAAARALAADAAGRLGMTEAAGELVEALRHDGDWRVRRRSAEALVEVQGPGADEQLAFLLAHDPHRAVRIRAIELSAESLEEDAAVGMILESLRDDDPAVQLAAYGRLKALTGLEIHPDDYGRWKEQIEKGHWGVPGGAPGPG